MTIRFQSHGGKEKRQPSVPRSRGPSPGIPAPADVAVDERADFGYLFPPSDCADDYLPDNDTTVAELDRLGGLMVDARPEKRLDVHVTPDSSLPPVMTYWGQFLDHELTARTDREGEITSIENPAPRHAASEIESRLKNARTPAFDLDSVYGGTPLVPDLPEETASVISGMRHPVFTAKMRVGTAEDKGANPDGSGAVPDGLDSHRDLPRYGQVEDKVRKAALKVAAANMDPDDLEKFTSSLNSRAIIGDMRNEENLAIAQFHVSFLRFHNRAVDYLEQHDTGWVADFHAAQTLTRLHYQWLAIEGYLKKICKSEVVERVVSNRASSFFRFRAEHVQRNSEQSMGNALPLEFSVAAFRFGHTMVRNVYDFNRNFGRGSRVIPNAPFDLLFAFTASGEFGKNGSKLPESWIIDWRRFVGVDPMDDSDGQPARNARSIDTALAPPLGSLINERNNEPRPAVKELFKHLARRNLRRGLSLRLPTGQALHRYLRSQGELSSEPIEDIGALFDLKPELQAFLRNSESGFNHATPLWFYCLAEAEAAGGECLGELGSWIVASTFVGVMLSDPTSALSTGFQPTNSPLRTENGMPVDTIARWMEFALVMEAGGPTEAPVDAEEATIAEHECSGTTSA